MTTGHRILIIDDEPLILEVLESQLNSMGLTCRTYESPLQGLRALNDFQPDIILCDLRMPDMNGVEVLARVRSLGLKTPFFLMTGFSDKNDLAETADLHLAGLIEKPFRLSELKKLLFDFFTP